MQDSNSLLCNLQDSNFLSCSLQGRSLLSCSLHDRNFLSCNLQVRCLLSCKLQDSSFVSCNLHDRHFLIGNLIHIDVAEAQLNFRRSYLWWLRNLACGDLIGNNGIEIEPVYVLPGLVSGEGMVWWSVCGLQWLFNIIEERDRRPS